MKWFYLKNKNKVLGSVLANSINDAILFFYPKEKIKGYYLEPYSKYYIIVLKGTT